MFRPLKWLEQKLFTGEVIRDYGAIHKVGSAMSGTTHSLLLCRKRGEDVIVIRHSHRAVLSFSISYSEFPAAHAEKIAEMLIDIASRRDSNTLSTP